MEALWGAIITSYIKISNQLKLQCWQGKVYNIIELLSIVRALDVLVCRWFPFNCQSTRLLSCFSPTLSILIKLRQLGIKLIARYCCIAWSKLMFPPPEKIRTLKVAETFDIIYFNVWFSLWTTLEWIFLNLLFEVTMNKEFLLELLREGREILIKVDNIML